MIRVRFKGESLGVAGEEFGHFEGGRLICCGSEIRASEAPPLEIVEIEGDDSDLAQALANGYRVTHPEGWKLAKYLKACAALRKRYKWPENAEEILSDPTISHVQAAQALGMKYATLVQTRRRLFPGTLNPRPRKAKE